MAQAASYSPFIHRCSLPPIRGTAEYARHQQPGREREQQAQGAADYVLFRQGEADADVAERSPYGERGQAAAREQDQRGQSPSGKSAEEKRVENVAYVFEEQRPARAVERIHLADSPDFGTGGRGDEQGVHQRGYEQHGHGDFRDIPDRAALKVEHDGSDQGSDHDHGLQADQPALEEVADGHLFPPVVVGVADDEAGENEEEINGQVSVIDFLVQMTGGVGFEQMEADDRQGCHSAQSVQ